MANLISNGTCIRGLSWAVARLVGICTACLNLKHLYRGLNRLSHVWSQQHIISQVCVLGAASGVGKASRMYIPRTGERVRSLQLPRLPGSSSRVNQWSCPLDDLLRHFTPCDWLLQSYMTPSLSTMCPDQGGSLPRRWFIGCYLAALEADTIATIQAHAKENTNEIMISKVSNHLFKNAMIWTTDLLNSLGWG